MNKYDFSIIIFNSNQNNLIRCLKSIERQKYDKDKIEVIIETEKITKEEKKQLENIDLNIILREQKELNIYECYNDAKSICKGSYLNFINTCILYTKKNTLKNIKEITKSYSLICTNIDYLQEETNIRKKYTLSSILNEEIQIENTCGQINLCLESYFINKKLCDKLEFDNKYGDEFKIRYIIELYRIQPTYFNMGKVAITSISPLEDNISENPYQYTKTWYNKSLEIWKDYIEQFSIIPIYIQEIIMYLIYIKFNCNVNDRNKNILKQEELNDFIDITKEILKVLDNNIILQNRIDKEFKVIKHRFKIPKSLKYYFFKLKENKPTSTYISNNTIFDIYVDERFPIMNFSTETINVYAINYINNKLIFDCAASMKDYLDEKDIYIQIKYGDEVIKIEKSNIYNIEKVFGNTYNEKYFFKFEVDLKNEYKDIKAYIIYKNKKYQLNFNYIKVQSRLNNSKRSYWAYKNFILENKIDKIKVSKKSMLKTFKLELLFIISKLINEKDKLRVCKLSFLRLLYYITRPILKHKHIWITFDKLYKAGDNGEYMYQYSLKNKKNIYYIIKKDSPDYKRLKKQNRYHILNYNSLRAKLYSLHAEAILKTHANIYGFCGFNGLARTFITGLFNAEVIEIQHGLTIQDIPEYQNRLVDNIKLYCIASKYENNNISKPEYDYKSAQIKVTGLARYDGLKNDDKKIILITPTWRHSIASPSLQHGTVRGYNNEFKSTDYFKIYNSLINNKTLIECAKKNNYKIKYLIHPTLSNQIEDFDKNEYVEILAASGDVSYETILRESSIMITDYSGVQYDFGYMRKPIIYFHPNELPPHYDNGSMDYENKGFGTITKTINELVSEIKKCVENNCQNEKKYINRADDFFEYDDLNNCKRIYEEIEEFLRRKEN